MLEVMKTTANMPLKSEIKQCKEEDIIVTKYQVETTYNENGDIIIKRIPKKVNVTKLVNATAKTIKKQSAEETIKKIEELFTKK